MTIRFDCHSPTGRVQCQSGARPAVRTQRPRTANVDPFPPPPARSPILRRCRRARSATPHTPHARSRRKRDVRISEP
eukprot:6639070-Prymnesium_polylepis.1